MELQPYDWVASDIDSVFTLRAWCHKRNSSEKVLLVVEDHFPAFVVQIGRPATKSHVPLIVKWLKDKLHKPDLFPVGYKASKRKLLYYYKESPDALTIIFHFESSEARYKARKIFLENAPKCPENKILRNSLNLSKYSDELFDLKIEIHEKSITDVTRFLVENDLTFCQWLRIPEMKPTEDNKISNVEEYRIRRKDITPVPAEESLGWKTFPTVMGFDIEVNSSKEGHFPNAKRKEDEMYMLSLVVADIGSGSPQKNIIITTVPCDEIQNCEIIHVGSEIGIIKEFLNQIHKYNPTVLSGYNIFGFDIKYMTDRVIDDYPNSDPWKYNNMSLLTSGRTTYYETKRRTNSGREFNYSLLLAEGRHFIDMYVIAAQEYQFLPDLRLDTVAKTFLGRGKNPVTPEEMFEAFRRKCPKRMAEVAAYCVVDSAVCIDLIEKVHTWTNLVETSNIVNVSMTDIFLKGQQIRVLNMVFKWAYANKFIVNSILENKAKFQGAHVVVPEPGLHENVIILDFASLYPSIIIAYNICHTTFIPNPDKYNENIYNVFEWEHEGVKHKHHFVKKEIFKGIIPSIAENLLVERRKVKAQMKDMSPDAFEYNILNAKQSGLKVSANSIYGMYGTGSTGKLPLIQGGEAITHIGRTLIKNSLNYAVNEFDAEIVYGDTDSIMINMKLDVPEQRKRVLEKLEVKDDYPNEGLLHVAVGMAFEDVISSTFVKPLRLEFEGVAKYLLSLKKKKYAKLMINPKTGETETEIDQHGNETMKLDIKGLPCIQKGTCTWARNQYLDTLKAIIGGKGLEAAKAVVKSYVDDLIEGKTPDEDLVLQGIMGATYKEDSNSPNKIFSQNMSSKGHNVDSGRQFRYVIVKSESTKKGDNMCLYDEIYLNGVYDINKKYYITNVAGTSIDSLLFHSFYSTDKTGEFRTLCECGKSPEVVNSPCGHMCYCLDCYIILEGYVYRCPCGVIRWYEASASKCYSCDRRLVKNYIHCRLCQKRLLPHYTRMGDGKENFEKWSAKYKYMRSMA